MGYLVSLKCFSVIFYTHLLQQRHPFRLGITASAGDTVQVYATGHSGTRYVGAVPHCLVASCRLYLPTPAGSIIEAELLTEEP